MEMLKQPLAMSKKENIERLEQSERARDDKVYEGGNRHDRRAMAKRERSRKKQKV